jgi:hypothetical protein
VAPLGWDIYDLVTAAASEPPSPTGRRGRSPRKGLTEGRGGHGGGRGGANDTPVTGDEAAKFTAALKAKDSTVTVTSVNGVVHGPAR